MTVDDVDEGVSIGNDFVLVQVADFDVRLEFRPRFQGCRAVLFFCPGRFGPFGRARRWCRAGCLAQVGFVTW